jgi:uncharacterized protein YhfF
VTPKRTDVVNWPHLYFAAFQADVESGIKTRTMREWTDRYASYYADNVGCYFKALRGYSKETHFGWVRVLSVSEQKFGDTAADCLVDEGCGHLTLAEFKALKCFKGCKADTKLRVVRFVFFAELPV